MIALIPATIVAAVVGKDGINALLVASQFVLSLVLPFVVLPLVWLTSNERVMSVPIHEWPAIAQKEKEGLDDSLTKTKSESVNNTDEEKGIKSLAPSHQPPLTLSPIYSSGSTETEAGPAETTPRMKSFKNGSYDTGLCDFHLYPRCGHYRYHIPRKRTVESNLLSRCNCCYVS
jgi:metal iron transporter